MANNYLPKFSSSSLAQRIGNSRPTNTTILPPEKNKDKGSRSGPTSTKVPVQKRRSHLKIPSHMPHSRRRGIQKWQEESKPNPGYQALGSWIYVDDEDGWVFRTIEQQLKKPTITEEEVTWAYSGSRSEEVEKYARRYQYDNKRKRTSNMSVDDGTRLNTL
ncbi:3995_t:CDS:2 [Paraglomus occultum]|uniref:3995_t:CDS:1 n=1 Tax=Paraglomus occultum TaxID=144539 RepID=A0A9N9AJ02_9GLOM|nr:3995_t:CDS:2 [Paraglomus occultum]